MVSSPDKEKYFKAYKSIKCVLDLTHNITTTVDNIYFINVETIKNYLEILNKHKILEMIIDITKKSELKYIEKKIYDEFGDYKLETGIEIININSQDINEDKEFILVDKDFLMNMKIDKGAYEGKQHSIIVKKNERHIELKGEDEEKIIVNLIEIQNKTGIYKFKTEESVDFNEYQSMAEDVKKELEQKDYDEDDPEVGLFRTGQRKKDTDKNQVQKEQNQEKRKETKENIKDINNQDNLIKNDNPPIKEMITKRAPCAKMDEIVYSIYSSLSNNVEKDKIFDKIKKEIPELNIKNELEETDTNIDIIGNIETSVIYLIKNYGLGNQNLININQSQNSDYYYKGPNLIDELDEKSKLIQSRNNENNPHENNKDFNPFEFTQVKFIDCEKCNNEENQEFHVGYFILNLNDECNNIDDCFKLSFLEKCSRHNINMKCNYKFKTTPEILILKFVNPKNNKKYIKFNEIEKNINLKNHMYLPNNLNIKYELLKVFYVLDDSNDKKLYVDISKQNRNNYIPYIIFYKKMNDE